MKPPITVEQAWATLVEHYGWQAAQQTGDRDFRVPDATCAWEIDADFEVGDTYHSACGESWSFTDGGPTENRVRFCHGCGKPVVLQAAKESNDG